LALRPLKTMYGHAIAADFDAPSLVVVREEMIKDGRCRNRMNKNAARVKQLFRWAASKEFQIGTRSALATSRATSRVNEPEKSH
jgi:hypothetical protein